MAVLQRPRGLDQDNSASQYRYGTVGATFLFALTIALTILLSIQHPFQWVSLAWLPVILFLTMKWRAHAEIERVRLVITNRLKRLPSEFTVLHQVKVLAPWGYSRIDHLILSQFGIVVASNDPESNRLSEQVEAVRYLLSSTGLAPATSPILSLTLLPPATVAPPKSFGQAPVVSVEQVRLNHLAPSTTAVFSTEQLHSITQFITHLQHVAY